MLDIEQDLKNDATGEYKKSIVTKLRDTSAEVRNELGQGLVPDEYKKLSGLLMALESSIKIVEQY
ncbi:MAG TPA: EscE/YscE/SsaE family type III secretion system needle protein co-chaperone [Leucothrix mucor]|nr:EscE/YscE/SsaE family type III secretion system needle protein co-chaperone [Leucothrix mucor]